MNKEKQKNLINKIIHFIQYHNAFTVALMPVFVFNSVILASEDLQNVIIGQALVTENGLDNTAILSTNLDSLARILKAKL